MYRGYIRTKNKKALQKLDTAGELSTVKDAEEYAGVLSDDIILIDVDDPEQSKLLFNIVKDKKLDCRVIQTTRGMHFLFKNTAVKNNSNNVSLAVGVKVDIKLGSKNSYQILKQNNTVRTILYDKDLSVLPVYFLPIKSAPDFPSIKEGERNQTLFNYILTLQSNDYTTRQVKETITIINKYILQDPLPKRELDTILRDEAFESNVFYKNNKFLFDKFAIYLKNHHNITRINNQLHYYKEGVYVDGLRQIEAQIIKSLPGLNRSRRREVMDYLQLLIEENSPVSSGNFIAFANGVLNIIDGELIPYSPEIIITNKIPWEYNKNSYDELTDRVLNDISCNDSQIRSLLEESIGYCFYRRNELGKAFILIGDRSNGKSTFLDMVAYLLGQDNISALDLGELGDRFKTAELFGKLANIGDDIGDEFIPNASIFKKLVTGERVSVERKGQDPFEFNNFAKFLFSANNLPRIKDRTGAVQRRLTIIPFNAKFTNDDPNFDPYIKYKLRSKSCMEYLVRLGVEGLKRVLANREFTSSDKVQEELARYEEINNPIIGFLGEIDHGEIYNEPTKTVYKQYQIYCIENNLQALSRIEFSRQMVGKFGFETVDKRIDGKKYRIFIGGD